MLKSTISISVIDAKGHIGVFGNKFQSKSGLITFFSKALQHRVEILNITIPRMDL
jgi:hypothetical protein